MEKKGKAGNVSGAGGRKGAGVMVKLVGVLVPAIVVVIAVLIVFVRQNTTNILVEESDSLIEAQSVGTVHQIESWMQLLISHLEDQRSTLEFVEMTPEEEKSYLLDMLDPNSSMPGGMYIGQWDHAFIHATYEAEPDFDPLSRSWYQEGLHNTAFQFSVPHLDVITHQIVVPAVCTIRYPNGAFRGVASGNVELSALSDFRSLWTGDRR